MPNTPNVSFKVVNNAVVPTAPLQGVMFVQGVTERGPFGDASTLITSWPQFTRIHGGYIAGSDFPLYVKRALDGGAQLRVSRQGHYTDITDASTLDAVAPTISSAIVDGTPDNLFTFTSKYEGANYNDLYVTISAATNGNANDFNMTIGITTDSNVTEVYKNLNIPGTPTVATSEYLKDVISNSALLDVTYLDLSALTGPLRPVDATYTFSGGSDGTAPNDVDYIGDAGAATGFHAFDDYDDAYFISAPTETSNAIAVAANSYVVTRKDLIYLFPISNSLTTATAIASFRTTTAINSDSFVFLGGGLKVIDPISLTNKDITLPADVMGLSATTQSQYNEWTSFAGNQKGLFQNAVGVVNNFGAPSKFDDLNLLANRQVNMSVFKGGLLYLQSGFTAALSASPLSFISTKVLILFIQKSLRPILEQYLEEPSDIPTFKDMANVATGFLDALVNQRALSDYSWEGDQDASSIDTVQVNTPADIQQGIYKVNLKVKPIQPLQEIEVNILITPAGVSF